MNNKKDNTRYAMILEHVSSNPSSAMAQKVSAVDDNDWIADHNEGKLSVDVAQNDTHLFLVSTMAGAAADKIEVFVHYDLLTIRGLRNTPLDERDDIEYFYQECFWGVFSRTIVLPTDVKGDKAHATYQNGMLSISIPKHQSDTKISVEIIED